jgi:hypothetical protein
VRQLAVVLVIGLALAAAGAAQQALGLTRDGSGLGRPAAPSAISSEADTFGLLPGIGSGGGVSYGGGPVLTTNRTHVIFWAPSRSHVTFDRGYRALVERFLTNVAAASHNTSNVLALTGQYTDSASRPAAYASRYAGAVLDTDRLPTSGCVEPPATGPGWPVCLTDSQLQAEIERVVQEHKLPTTRRDVYFLVTPRGLGSCMDAAPTSGCALGGSVNGYCGYHRFTNDGLVDYAFIPYNAVPGHCQSSHPRPNGSTADPALSTISHELAEMITDPGGDGWTGGSGNEIGDLCITNFGPVIGGSGSRRYNESIAGGHYYLQEEWSNASGGCAPRAKPDQASFSVTSRAGRTLGFMGSGTDPEGRILSYRWAFGDGTTASGRTVTHRFPPRSEYPVRLRVTDSWDNWGFYTRVVSVA